MQEDPALDELTRDRSLVIELADLLRVSPRTIRAWAVEGYSLAAIRESLNGSGAAHDQAWLSITSTAARFDVDETTVRRWIASGYVVARRFGPKLIRVSVASVIKFSRPLGLSLSHR